MTRYSVVLVSLFICMWTVSAAAQPNPPSPVSPIVGGEKESGWLGVGALVQWSPGIGFTGSFCSGTLIAPQWVLTAGHCLAATDGNPAPVTVLTRFLIGPDARPADIGVPPEGTRFYQADRFFIHPEYDPNYSPNDIALMHLSEPAIGMPTYAYSHNTMDDSYVGEEVFYVGFGVTSGDDQMGGSQKRSVYIPIVSVKDTTYRSSEDGVGVCFGDSGGPGLLDFDGTWEVVGVNSMVQGGYDDPCAGTSIQTRVDVFSEWIDEHLDSGHPSCLEEDELCWCPAACNENGYCNNTVCQTRTCDRMYRCIRKCQNDGQGSECSSLCFVKAPEEERQHFHDLMFCSMLACGNLEGEAEEQCRENHCPDEYALCDPTPATGEYACEKTMLCVADCADDACKRGCFENATVDAQQLFDPLWDCAEDLCGQVPTRSLKLDCIWEQCAAELETCVPPSDCSPAGGDCEEGFACAPTPMGRFDCFPSLDQKSGQTCNPDAEEYVPCQDGMACVADTEGGYVCKAVCAAPSDCQAPLECGTAGAWQGVANIGTCVCIDEDGDGACRTEDCDDQDDTLAPGIEEVCDEADNNCDGVVDEGCGPPLRTEEEKDEGNGNGGCSGAPVTATSPMDTGLLLALLILLFATGRFWIRRTQ